MNNGKRLVALAATTAVTVGGAVAAAAPAQAASVWDAVAQCESGGRWSINTGNGYHGGLQFSASTWRAYGGTAYAPQASQATKAQQIAVAQKVLAGQGPNAWPVCSKKAGLTKANGGASASAAVVDSTPKATATKKAEAPKATATKKAEAPKATATRKAEAPKATAKAEAPKATATKKAEAPKAATTQKTAAPKATAKKAEAPKKAQAAKVEKKAAAPKRAASVKATETTGKRYVVKSGDTLSEIARDLNIDGGWKALWEANKGSISNPDLIFVGQTINL